MSDTENMTARLISDKKNYIIMKGTFMKLVKLKTQRQCQLGRVTVDVAPLLGQLVGSQFKLLPVQGKKLVVAERVERAEDLADVIETDESAADNRNLLDDPSSQSLTRENIMDLREQGASGKEIITTIIDNSRSFQNKTEYSQAKYVRKKQKKYFEFISVHEPCVQLVADMYYMQDPLKIMNLRLDSLAQMLTACNVGAGGRYLVMESGCLGLTVAAVLERLGGQGRLVHLYQGGTPQRQAVEAINFSREQLDPLTCVDVPTVLARFPAGGTPPEQTPVTPTAAPSVSDPAELSGRPEGSTETVSEHTDGPQRKRRPSAQPEQHRKKSKYCRTLAEDQAVSLDLLATRSLDGLIVCCRQHPLNVLEYLLDFLGLSRPFAVFCPYQQPLLECYFAMKAKGCIMLKLTETWLRNYQVLPERTHPEISMSGGGGYLLTGYRVDRSLNASQVD